MLHDLEHRYGRLSALSSLLYVLAFPAIVHFVRGGELFGAFFVVPVTLIAMGWGPRTGLITAAVGIAYSEVVMNVEHFVIHHMGNSPRWLTIVVAPALVYFFVAFLVGKLGDALRKQHKVEAALAEQEKRYRSLIGNLAMGILVADKNETITFVNPTAEKIFGIPDRELIGKNLKTFLSEEDYEYVSAETTMRSIGETSVYEIDIRRPNGEIRHVQVTAAPEFDANGEFTGTFGTMLDISDTYLSKSLLGTLLDSTPDFIYFKDLDGRFILTNRAHAQLVGLNDPSAMIGRTDFNFFSREHSEAAREDEQRIIQTREAIIDRQEKKTWPHRPSTWLSTTKMPLLDQKGEIMGTFGISRDISERRQMEERNSLLATMVESSNDAIVGVDLDLRISSWNQGAQRIFGHTSEEMVGKQMTVILSADTIAQIPKLRGQLAQAGYVHPFENHVSRKDGSQVYVSTSLSALFDEDRKLIGVVAISTDMTERRALQTQIIRSQRLEGLAILAAGIAHQFNNANAAIKGRLSLLSGDGALTESARSHLAEALKAVDRVVEVTEKLQGFSSAATTETENHRLEEEIPALLMAFEGRLGADGITLKTDWQQTIPVRTSLSLLNFLTTSLTTNAIHALIDRPSPTIRVRTQKGEGFSLLEVADNGCGIPQENMSRIFTPFFTTKGEWADPRSPQSTVKGIGLSLAVCQSSVAESGGWIEVESLPGSGATFRVWLPTIPSP